MDDARLAKWLLEELPVLQEFYAGLPKDSSGEPLPLKRFLGIKQYMDMGDSLHALTALVELLKEADAALLTAVGTISQSEWVKIAPGSRYTINTVLARLRVVLK